MITNSPWGQNKPSPRGHRGLTHSTYDWVIEGDITACFDNVDHQVLIGLVAERITDRKVLRLVRAFLRAGIVEQHGGFAASLTGTPQGGVISPLLANIYLSVLDRPFGQAWDTEMSPPWRRQQRRRRGQPNYRLVRYADDFVVLVLWAAASPTPKRSGPRSASCWPPAWG
jgi:RNA-directed DNA polymerase